MPLSRSHKARVQQRTRRLMVYGSADDCESAQLPSGKRTTYSSLRATTNKRDLLQRMILLQFTQTKNNNEGEQSSTQIRDQRGREKKNRRRGSHLCKKRSEKNHSCGRDGLQRMTGRCWRREKSGCCSVCRARSGKTVEGILRGTEQRKPIDLSAGR